MKKPPHKYIVKNSPSCKEPHLTDSERGDAIIEILQKGGTETFRGGNYIHLMCAT